MNRNYDFRIIIIDDNPSIHRDFIKILTVNQIESKELEAFNKTMFDEQKPAASLPSFRIDTATQGEQGVELIAKAVKENKPYALAFVDIRMPPGWDGIQTIKNIWALDKNIQVVICTAYSDYSWEDTIRELGQSENLLILKKPFDQVAVRQLTCALTQKWKLMHDVYSQMKKLEKYIQDRTDTLQQSISIKHATLESSADGIIVADLQGNIIDYNSRFLSMCHIPQDTIDKKKDYAIFKKIADQTKNPKVLLDKVDEIQRHQNYRGIELIKFKDKRLYECFTQPHMTKEKTLGRIWSFRDVTERARLENQLQYQATHDSLTNLPNRILLEERIQQAIHKADKNQGMFAVLFFDLDRFKLINDSLSHYVGDELLCAVAKRLQSLVKPDDTFARLGGDEFVMIINNVTNPANVIRLAEDLLHKISNPFMIANRKLMITTSLGISFYPRDGKTSEELLRNADTAMYNAKDQRANQYRIYTTKMNEDSIKLLEFEIELRQAIKNNQFFLAFQPQYDIDNNKIVAVEALVRWHHPTRGVLLPIDFIPLAEETGLIIPIGEWILRAACKQNKAWQVAGYPPIRIAVNVTAKQLRQLSFVDNLITTLNELKLKPEYLEIEFTENSILSNPEIINTISAIKEFGVQVALDNFGSGLSSLNYLRNVPLDRIKIDRSYVKNILTSQSDEVIIQAIIMMARSLHLEVLAEGVETKDQLNFLKEKKCGEIQGYYFSQPLSIEEFEILLRNVANIYK